MLGAGWPTRFTLGYFRLQQDNIPDYGIPWVTATHNVLAAYRDQPAPVPRESFYGLRSRDTERMGSDMATARFEHDFGDSSTLRNQLRFGRSTRNSITTAPRFASNDTLVINRNGPSWLTEDDIWDNQTDLRAAFRTGPIEHSVVTGANFTNEHNVRKSRTVAGAPTNHAEPDRRRRGGRHASALRLRHGKARGALSTERRLALGALRRQRCEYQRRSPGARRQDGERARGRGI
jgi:catecholate siderophore receptor